MEKEDNWLEELVQKYPGVQPGRDFYEISDVPKGWRPLIEALIENISWQITNPHKSKIKDTKLRRLALRWNDFIRAAVKKITKPWDPYSVANVSKGLNKSNEHKFYRLLIKLKSMLCINMIRWHVPYNPPPVILDQVKEKFGTLRFYVTSEDDTVKGMIYLAEALSEKTCQNTGKQGSLHHRGRWYATLSSAQAKKFGYTKVQTTYKRM